jgi:hypothetical protein
MSRFRDQCFRFLIARGRPLSTAAEHISCVAGQLVGTGDAAVGSGTVQRVLRRWLVFYVRTASCR